MTPYVTGGGGFLLAVVWFDLMFDVQVLRHRGGDLPEDVLASIAGYYRRVTTAARPMNRLVAAVMVGTLAAIVLELTSGDVAAGVAWTSLALAGGAVLLAALRTVPQAVRLGARTDTVERQSRLARAICVEHLGVLAALGTLLVVQLAR
ncbi:MAG TPA: hypothetical protein VGU73_08745 [Acidimicrobiia bacterium]|nr:hypothetical protein [Acidimicrobiia bacterium]